MRTLLACFVLFGTLLCTCADDADVEPLQSMIDTYLAKVGNVLMPALAPDLPPDAIQIAQIEVWFQIDSTGNPLEVKTTSSPPNESIEQGFTRTISKLHFPPAPERIFKEGGYKTLCSTPSSIQRETRSNQPMQPTAGRSEAASHFMKTHLLHATLALASGG